MAPKKVSVLTDPDVRKCCNCLKSKCLKLYCVCFANQELCVGCLCRNCCNNSIQNIERIRSRKAYIDRNPNTFKPKITTIGYVRQSRGCKCKQSQCMKNYCECYKAGVACNNKCACKNCLNNASMVKEAIVELNLKRHGNVVDDSNHNEINACITDNPPAVPTVPAVPTIPDVPDVPAQSVPNVMPINIEEQVHLDNKSSSNKKVVLVGFSPEPKPSSDFITQETIQRVVTCMLVLATQHENFGMPSHFIERAILDEFGFCWEEIHKKMENK